LQVDEKNSFLLIWPGYLSLDGSNNPIQAGIEITASGREIPPDDLLEYTTYPVPDECAGPYWSVVTVVSPSTDSSVPMETEAVFP
jgi:hypothetical protein